MWYIVISADVRSADTMKPSAHIIAMILIFNSEAPFYRIKSIITGGILQVRWDIVIEVRRFNIKCFIYKTQNYFTIKLNVIQSIYKQLITKLDLILKEDIDMQKYVCDVCGYVYDPAVGDPDNGIEPGTAFEDLPDDWACPLCDVSKDMFSETDE